VSGRPTLLGVPYDAASSFRRGAALAPPVLREALHSPASNLWTEAGVDLGEAGSLRDAGDLELSESLTGDAIRVAIEEAVVRIGKDGGRPIAIGGDHSITYPLVRGARRSNERFTLVHVDAHPDLYEAYEGDRFSHASPFARVMEEGLVDQLVQIGIRTMNGHQRAQAERYGVEVIDMRAWSAGRRPAVAMPVYLSIDLDGLDPAFAPGVSHREPGGLTVREVIGIIHGFAGRIIGADVVELNPLRDVDGVTATVGAKLVKELAGTMLGPVVPGRDRGSIVGVSKG
jgi:arginase